jgi:DNA-binding NtrC family response regulator
VRSAASAEDARCLASAHAGPIHLLLTDVVMPQMSGRQLAEQLGPLRPEMRVLYMSGYTDDAVVRRGVKTSSSSFVSKPFAPDDLARKVREALDAPAPR